MSATPPTRAEESLAELLHIARENPAVWFEVAASIALKDGTIVEPGLARVNVYQRRIAEVITWCLANNRPARILGLKPRQKGSSTFFVACIYWFLSRMRAKGCIIGGAHSQGDNLFKMLRLYAAKDALLAPGKCRVVDRKARWANGSECTQETAANPEAGRSGTFQCVVATEVARWSREGVANAADVLAGLLKCVPFLPGTLIALESTADGAAGDFYERWQKAITFDELKAGKDGFVKVFAAWFEFEDSTRDPAKEGIGSPDDLTDKERELSARFGLSLEQVAWMRWAIRDECSGDFDKFCEDYPFDPESAFLTSGRRRFNVAMIRRMRERAAIYPPDLGVIAEVGDGERWVWQGCGPDECQVLRWEPPKGGCRYLLAVDPATGATQAGGKDPDSHAAIVLREGYWVDGRGWVPAKVVARLVDNWPAWINKRRYALRWDIDVLERKIWALAQYYANCRLVIEANMDRGLIELLKLRGTARLFERTQFNRREQVETNAYGWMTTPATRESAIEILARAIREFGREGEGVDICCPIILSELESFVVNEKGRSEAMPGTHDDNVLALAIGLACIGSATNYTHPVTRVELPPDIARLIASERRNTTHATANRW